MTTRGDLVLVALPGDYGKPRPALVIQSDLFPDHPSITLLPITTHLVDAPLLRVDIGQSVGLERASQLQIDKPQTVRRGRIGPTIGRIDSATLLAVSRALAVFLGLV
jgi:mRNA interferase MazF